MRRKDSFRIDFQDFLPGLPELKQVFDPDDYPFPAGESIHGRVTAEQDAVLQQGNMVRGMPWRFQHLKRQPHRFENVRTERNQPVKVFFPDGRIPVIPFSEQCQYPAEEQRQSTRTASLEEFCPVFSRSTAFG